jgi:hypothetical protein
VDGAPELQLKFLERGVLRNEQMVEAPKTQKYSTQVRKKATGPNGCVVGASLRMARREAVAVWSHAGNDKGQTCQAIDWRAVAAGRKLEQQALLVFIESVQGLSSFVEKKSISTLTRQ